MEGEFMRYATRKYLDMPEVIIDNRLFVDQEYFIDKVIQDIRDCQKDCDSQDEFDGMDEAITILLSTKKENSRSDIHYES